MTHFKNLTSTAQEVTYAWSYKPGLEPVWLDRSWAQKRGQATVALLGGYGCQAAF